MKTHKSIEQQFNETTVKLDNFLLKKLNQWKKPEINYEELDNLIKQDKKADSLEQLSLELLVELDGTNLSIPDVIFLESDLLDSTITGREEPHITPVDIKKVIQEIENHKKDFVQRIKKNN